MTSTGDSVFDIRLRQIEQKLDTAIQLLMEQTELFESQSGSPEERKLHLFLQNTSPKVVGFTYRIPEESHTKFKQKCCEEGWSIQEGVSRLIQAFIEDRIVIKS